MKKIKDILFIFICMIALLSCKNNGFTERFNQSSSCMYYKEHLYFEEIQDNKAYISMSDLNLKNSQRIDEINDFVTFSIIKNKLYYIKKDDNVQAVLYTMDLENLNDKKEVGTLGEYKSIKVGSYNGCEFSAFALDGNEYVLYNNSVYSLKDNLKRVRTDIVSVYYNNDRFYYSDFNGDIFEYNVLTKEIKKVLSRDKLLLGKQMNIFGDNISAHNIVISGDYLYYIGGEISYNKGNLYKYDIKESQEPEYICKSTDKFYVYDSRILYLSNGNLNLMDLDSNYTEIVANNVVDFYVKNENTVYVMFETDNNYNYTLLKIK